MDPDHMGRTAFFGDIWLSSVDLIRVEARTRQLGGASTGSRPSSICAVVKRRGQHKGYSVAGVSLWIMPSSMEA